uniref:YidB family protein n=1 Tax=Actinomadura sp. CA-154981 TaxID=3240037 RepID=UPI003F49A756
MRGGPGSAPRGSAPPPTTSPSPAQLRSALDDDVLQEAASAAGVSVQELTDQLAQELPKAADELTPGGELPDEARTTDGRELDPVGAGRADLGDEFPPEPSRGRGARGSAARPGRSPRVNERFRGGDLRWLIAPGGRPPRPRGGGRDRVPRSQPLAPRPKRQREARTADV